LALAQEYFTTDAQLLWALAAQETKYGVENMTINDLEKKMGTTTAIGGGITGVIPIEYGAWRVRASSTGLEGTFGTNTQIYQYYFKRRRNVMYQAESRNKYLNYLSAFQLTLQGAPANYYMRGWSDFDTRDDEMKAVLNNLIDNRLPSIHTAAISNQMFTALICLMANDEFFNILRKDFEYEPKNVCWANVLENMKDQYLGVAILIDLYKRAETADVGNALKTAATMLTSNYNATISDANASGKFPNATPVIDTIKQLVAASRDFETGNGAASDIIDFEIDKKTLLELFFGDGGTPEKQGKGGILLHFADQKRMEWDDKFTFSLDGENMSIDYMPMRRRIWSTLNDAFDACAGKAPNAAGTGKVGSDKISYRYDLLSVLRTVKVNFPFASYTVEPLAAGMNAALKSVPNNTVKCPTPVVPPVTLDNIYPYIDTVYQESMTGDSCIIIVKMRDVHSTPVKGKVKRVLGTPDFFWVEWTPAVMTWANKDTSEATFRLALSRDEADRLNSESAAGGRYVWVMAEDAGGNSVIRKLPIKLARDSKISLKWAGVFDTPTGDGTGDLIKAEITGLSDLIKLNPVYSYSWNSPSSKEDTIKSADIISASGNIFTARINPSEGFGSGMLYVEYNNPDDPSKKMKDSVVLGDSCGPAISAAEFNPYPEGNKSKPDTLRVKFTENTNDLSNLSGKVLIYFAKDSAETPQSFSVQSAKKLSDDYWEFLYKSEQIAPNRKLQYKWVKIKYDAGVTDEIGNLPLDDNQWVKINDMTVNKQHINLKFNKAEYFDTSNPADGYIDLIKVDYSFGNAGDYKKYRDELNKMLEQVVLPKNRSFNKIEGINFIDDNSLEIKVSQDKNKFGVPKTYIDNGDTISFSGNAVDIDEEWDIPVPKSVPISDKIAPVITRARFKPMKNLSGDGKFTDTLYLHFSEPIREKTKIVRDAFVVTSPSRNDLTYRFDFRENDIRSVDRGGDSVALFVIDYTKGAPLPPRGDKPDSIRIAGGKGIVDVAGNKQDTNTVFVEIEADEYGFSYDVKIYPNPYYNDPSVKKFVTKNGVSDKNPAIEEYAVNGENLTDMAVIVKVEDRSGGVGENNMSGKITVLDQLGNKIVDREEFVLGKNNSTLIWTWNGKNKNGRTVGAGFYQAIIVITDNDVSLQLPPYKIGIKK